MSQHPGLMPVDPDSGFVSSRARTRHRGWLVRWFGWVSSLYLAVSLMAALLFVIFVGTWYEKAYGQVAAAVMIYQAWWFDLIFAVLALNVLGAALTRLPWKRRHIGFVIVHAGLLTLIAGFVRSGHSRLDGMLLTRPGEVVSTVELPRERIAVIKPDGNQMSPAMVINSPRVAGYPSFARFCMGWPWPLPPLGVERNLHLPLLSEARDGVDLALTGMCIAGDPVLGYREGLGGVPKVGFQLRLRTPMAPTLQAERELWLDPDQLDPITVGPLRGAIVSLREPAVIAAFADPSAESATNGRLIFGWNGERAEVVIVPDALPQTLEFSGGKRIQLTRFIPRARLDRERQLLIDDPTSEDNPIVEYRYASADSATSAMWNRSAAAARYLFPGNAGGPEVFYRHPLSHRTAPGQLNGEFQIVVGGDQRLYLRWWTASRGFGGVRSLTAGQHLIALVGDANSPMEIQAQISWLPSAVPEPVPVAMKPERIDQATRWFEFTAQRQGQTTRAWIARDVHGAVPIPGATAASERVFIKIEHDVYDLNQRHGFAVRLDDYLERKDPGSERSAAFTSTATLLPSDGGPAETRTTIMNQPLSYRGVWLFQGSPIPAPIDQQGRPQGREGMAFVAATDPGLWLKYLGSGILVGGILLMYLFRAFPGRS